MRQADGKRWHLFIRARPSPKGVGSTATYDLGRGGGSIRVDSPDTPGWLGYWLSDQGTVNLSIAEHSVSGNLTAHLTGQANTYTHLALSGSWACSY